VLNNCDRVQTQGTDCQLTNMEAGYLPAMGHVCHIYFMGCKESGADNVHRIVPDIK